MCVRKSHQPPSWVRPGRHPCRCMPEGKDRGRENGSTGDLVPGWHFVPPPRAPQAPAGVPTRPQRSRTRWIDGSLQEGRHQGPCFSNNPSLLTGVPSKTPSGIERGILRGPLRSSRVRGFDVSRQAPSRKLAAFRMGRRAESHASTVYKRWRWASGKPRRVKEPRLAGDLPSPPLKVKDQWWNWRRA